MFYCRMMVHDYEEQLMIGNDIMHTYVNTASWYLNDFFYELIVFNYIVMV